LRVVREKETQHYGMGKKNSSSTGKGKKNGATREAWGGRKGVESRSPATSKPDSAAARRPPLACGGKGGMEVGKESNHKPRKASLIADQKKSKGKGSGMVGGGVGEPRKERGGGGVCGQNRYC